MDPTARHLPRSFLRPFSRLFRYRLLPLAALLVAACAQQPPAPGGLSTPGAPVITAPAPESAGAPPAPVSPPEPVQAARPVPPPRPLTLEDYRRILAERIVQASAGQVFEGPPPPMLRSVVVLSLRIDATGRPVRLQLLRGNGHRDLEEAALRSVQQAVPLPEPGALAAGPGDLEFSETWLFREDGRFQLRTLAEPQQSGS